MFFFKESENNIKSCYKPKLQYLWIKCCWIRDLILYFNKREQQFTLLLKLENFYKSCSKMDGEVFWISLATAFSWFRKLFFLNQTFCSSQEVAVNFELGYFSVFLEAEVMVKKRFYQTLIFQKLSNLYVYVNPSIIIENNQQDCFKSLTCTCCTCKILT